MSVQFIRLLWVLAMTVCLTQANSCQEPEKTPAQPTPTKQLPPASPAPIPSSSRTEVEEEWWLSGEEFGDFDGLTISLPPAMEKMIDLAETHKAEIIRLEQEELGIRLKLAEKKLDFQKLVEPLLTEHQLKSLAKRRLQKAADDIRMSQYDAIMHSCLAKIESSEEVLLYEGVSESLTPSERAKLIEEGAIEGGVFSEPLQPSAELRARLMYICLNPNSYRSKKGPGKACLFHTDLLIVVEDEERTVNLAICTSCNEAILRLEHQFFGFDLVDGAGERIRELAPELFPNWKPATKKGEDE